jgi:DNA repair protein RecO
VGLNYAEPARSPLAARPEALAHVGYFAELLDEWAQDGDPSERLYRLGASLVDALAEGVSIEPLARYFEFWLLRLQGVYPPTLACQACGEALQASGRGAVLAPGADAFTCAGCAPAGRGLRLSATALSFLHAARRLPPREAGSVPMTAAALGELEAVHRALMGRHLDRELKSTRVLRDLRREAPPRPARTADSRR